jgi:hypothetical protein
MDWFILIVLVPFILLPVVLLWGFAGCTPFTAQDPLPDPDTPDPDTPAKPPAPFNLQVTTVTENLVELQWEHTTVGASFKIERAETATPFDPNHGDSPVDAKFVDGAVLPGTDYFYRVRAVVGGITSDESNTVKAHTLAWKETYGSPLTTVDGFYTDFCMVQRIDKSVLKFNGSKVRVTLRGATGTPVIDEAYISQADPGAANPYDSFGDLTLLGTNIGQPAPQPNPVVLGPIDYKLVKSQDLIVAFDISGSNNGTLRAIAGVGISTCYVRAGTNEAKEQIRTAGYAAKPNTVFLVERIEVLTDE